MDDVIERLQRRSADDTRAIPLGGGLPSHTLFPHGALAEAFARVLHADASAALQYGWPEGRLGLRSHIALRLRDRGVDVSAEDVVITSGAQQAIAIASRLVCKRGDAIGTADETYPAALELFRMNGLLPTIDPRRARAVYVMPAIGNPRGDTLDEDDRLAILSLGVPIIEDDAYADLWFDARPPAPLASRARDRVFYIGSFSKSLCPGLRVGYLVPPREALDEARAQKQTLDLQANSLAQSLIEHYLDACDFDAHLRTLRFAYARRAERLCSALRKHLPTFRFDHPGGGFSVWVETETVVDHVALLERAVARGTSFDPGEDFLVARAPTTTMRLSYAAADEDEIDEGVRRLALAWHDVVPTPRRAS